MRTTQTAAARDWGYATALLAAVSVLLLGLRLSGRAFLTLDFEALVIYLPTLVSLLIYVKMRGFGIFSRPAGGALSKAPS